MRSYRRQPALNEVGRQWRSYQQISEPALGYPVVIDAGARDQAVTGDVLVIQHDPAPAPEPVDQHDHDLDSPASTSSEGSGEIWSVYATGPVYGEHLGAQVLTNVHSRRECAPHPCWLHAPSNHHMRDWPVVFRVDAYKVERTCPHGIGHPDPDDRAFQIRIDREHVTSHGCDGCLRPPGG